MPYLYHCDAEPVVDIIDGIKYELPTDEVTEIENAFHAKALLSHKALIHGIVEVAVTKSKGGAAFNVEDAKKSARSLLQQCRKSAIDTYVKLQMEDRVKNGLPALPPHERLMRIIEEERFPLFNYFRPIGWTPKHLEGTQGTSTSTPITDSDTVAQLRTQLSNSEKKRIEAEDKVAELNSVVEALQEPGEQEQQVQERAARKLLEGDGPGTKEVVQTAKV